MKTQKQSVLLSPSIRSVSAVICSVCMSMLLFVGQVSAADTSAVGSFDNAEVVQANSSVNKGSAVPTQAADLVNLNKAGATVLSEHLKGIGFKKAQAIVDWRKANGNFASLEQLLEVKGIGEKILLVNRHKMTL